MPIHSLSCAIRPVAILSFESQSANRIQILHQTRVRAFTNFEAEDNLNRRYTLKTHTCTLPHKIRWTSPVHEETIIWPYAEIWESKLRKGVDCLQSMHRVGWDGVPGTLSSPSSSCLCKLSPLASPRRLSYHCRCRGLFPAENISPGDKMFRPSTLTSTSSSRHPIQSIWTSLSVPHEHS